MKELIKDLSFLELFILNTLVYFDAFDYPLTSNEIYLYLFTGGMDGQSFSWLEVGNCLSESLKLKKIIATSSGFYFLKGRKEIIKTRLQRYNLADKKFRIAKKTIKIFKFLPFIKLVAVCNSLAYNNAREESDIDLFIITSKKKLWLTRFCLILIISLLGLRPPKQKVRDKICLSFYITEDNLDLSQIKITANDIYLVYWLATLWPVYQRDNFYQKLIEANSWLKKYLPNWQLALPSYRRREEDHLFNKVTYKTREFILSGKLGDWLENLAKKIQLKFMSQKKKDLAVSGGSRVVISDSILKFHENDRRLEYLDKFEKKRLELVNKI